MPVATSNLDARKTRVTKVMTPNPKCVSNETSSSQVHSVLDHSLVRIFWTPLPTFSSALAPSWSYIVSLRDCTLPLVPPSGLRTHGPEPLPPPSGGGRGRHRGCARHHRVPLLLHGKNGRGLPQRTGVYVTSLRCISCLCLFRLFNLHFPFAPRSTPLYSEPYFDLIFLLPYRPYLTHAFTFST